MRAAADVRAFAVIAVADSPYATGRRYPCWRVSRRATALPIACPPQEAGREHTRIEEMEHLGESWIQSISFEKDLAFARRDVLHIVT